MRGSLLFLLVVTGYRQRRFGVVLGRSTSPLLRREGRVPKATRCSSVFEEIIT